MTGLVIKNYSKTQPKYFYIAVSPKVSRMVSPLDYTTQGVRILFSSWKHRLFPKKYDGSAAEICQQIVKECWNNHFFQTSTGNFPQFWTRDFGWCTQSLIKLGYTLQVHATLRYALNRFKEYNSITTTITPNGKPFDFPNFAADSLPWLIHSIKVSKFPYYSYRQFLNKEIHAFFQRVINPQTGLVNPNLHVSSIKDLAIRKSSCYDNCLVGLLANDLRELKLDNPFEQFNYPEIIKRHFWNGQYFYDDLSKQPYVAGDANIFPFVLGLIADKQMLASAVAKIQEAGLDKPFPLKYTADKSKVRFIWQEFLLKNYEGDSIWMHLGILYCKLLQQVDKIKAGEIKDLYTRLIERHKNYLEVFTRHGEPYQTALYVCDRGLLWAANYLTL